MFFETKRMLGPEKFGGPADLAAKPPDVNFRRRGLALQLRCHKSVSQISSGCQTQTFGTVYVPCLRKMLVKT